MRLNMPPKWAPKMKPLSTNPWFLVVLREYFIYYTLILGGRDYETTVQNRRGDRNKPRNWMKPFVRPVRAGGFSTVATPIQKSALPPKMTR